MSVQSQERSLFLKLFSAWFWWCSFLALGFKLAATVIGYDGSLSHFVWSIARAALSAPFLGAILALVASTLLALVKSELGLKARGGLRAFFALIAFGMGGGVALGLRLFALGIRSFH